MSVKHKLGGLAERTGILCVAVLCAFAVVARPSRAQEADHDHELDHEHAYLHFSHPLVTESPSPDTKFRFDAEFFRAGDPGAGHATEVRSEFEYAFARTFSLAVIVPYDRVIFPGLARASGLGDVELSAKAASFAFAPSGVLLGGGLTVGLPTGSDAKGIGSDHLYEISPFVDAALRRGPVELVGFLTYSQGANRNATDDNARAVRFDASALWRAAHEIELLAEVATARSYGGAESAYTETFIAPGIKWRPARFEKFAIGAAAIRGVGSASGTNAVQLSAFYHF